MPYASAMAGTAEASAAPAPPRRLAVAVVRNPQRAVPKASAGAASSLPAGKQVHAPATQPAVPAPLPPIATGTGHGSVRPVQAPTVQQRTTLGHTVVQVIRRVVRVTVPVVTSSPSLISPSSPAPPTRLTVNAAPLVASAHALSPSPDPSLRIDALLIPNGYRIRSSTS